MVGVSPETTALRMPRTVPCVNTGRRRLLMGHHSDGHPVLEKPQLFELLGLL